MKLKLWTWKRKTRGRGCSLYLTRTSTGKHVAKATVIVSRWRIEFDALVYANRGR